ncbi:MAG: multicopper oxidase family protein, partial [Actinomycetes bacterium]
QLRRRDVLKIGGLGVAGAVGIWGTGNSGTVLARTASALAPEDFPVPFANPFVRPPVLRPSHWEYNEAGKLAKQYFHLTAKETTVKILPRLTTRMWGYNGIVPGPTIKVDRGVETVVRVRNSLPAVHPLFGHEFTTSTHLHGSASLPQYDGYASDVTPPAFFKDYQYPNFQPARTLWYHDHAVHNTAKNVYTGLIAQYHIHDAHERNLLPQGEFDVPLVISDAMFAANGELGYDDESQSGLWGDVLLVNGRPWPAMRVQKRVYRFRFLAATPSRSFRFRLSTGDPMHVVATDGGLMPRTQAVAQFRQGSAERYEVLIDFRHYQSGQRIILENLSNENNRDYDHTNTVMAFDVMDDTFGDGVVDRSDPTWNRIPTDLG